MASNSGLWWLGRYKIRVLVVFGLFCVLSLVPGCWFVVLPLGPIVDVIRGPVYCVSAMAKPGDKVLVDGQDYAEVVKVYGRGSGCNDYLLPMQAKLKFKEGGR